MPDAVDELEARIRTAGHVVTIAGEVSSVTAAEICGVSPGTMRNWRSAGRGPAFQHRYGRVWYSTTDLARFLARS